MSATPTTRAAGAPQALALILSMLLPIIGILSLAPNLPAMMRHFADVPYAAVLVPMIITISALCIATLSPLMGAIADRWGRRRLLVAALILYCAVGMLPFLLSNLYAIIACRALVGIAEAAIMTTGTALMGDYFPGAERQKWLGLQGTVGPIAASCMILAGGALGTLSWQAPFLLYGIGALILVFVLSVTHEPQATHAESVADATERFPWSAALLMAGVTLFTALLYYIQVVQFGLIFSALGVESPAKIGLLITVASVGVVAGGWSYRYLGQRPIGALLAIVYLCYAVGLAGLGLASDYWTGMPFAVIAQFGNGLAVPALIGWALSMFHFAHRGRGMGLWNTCFFAGQFISPLIVTAVIGVVGGLLAALVVLGAVSFLAAVPAGVQAVRRRTARTAVAQSS